MAYTEIPITGGNFKIIGGRADGVDYQYQSVLDDFWNARLIRIATYNYDLPFSEAELSRLSRLINDRGIDAKVILGVPGIQNNNEWKKRLEDTLNQAMSCFHTEQIRINCVNHAKIIGTENMVYIGSQNISTGSCKNYEAGIIIEDIETVEKVYESVFADIWHESVKLDDAWDSFGSVHDCAFERTANAVWDRYTKL